MEIGFQTIFPFKFRSIGPMHILLKASIGDVVQEMIIHKYI
jgi:hypothetical protein